jgi:hypothetical protein
MTLFPDSFGRSLREANDCHDPDDGKFCSGPGSQRRQRLGRVRKGQGYQISFKSQAPQARWLIGDSDVPRKAKSARVVLTFDPWSTGQLGAPVEWVAPNGVTVFYKKGQRRSAGGDSVYHDFNAGNDEIVVPLTRNVGAGRRALRAWAATHLGNRITARMQARQMVRPGD